MLDEQNDRDSQSRSITFFVMMAALFAVSFYFMPASPPAPPADAPLSGTPAPSDPQTAASSEVAPALDLGLPKESENTEEDRVTLENAALRMEFTRVGARLKKATVVSGSRVEDTQQVVPEWDGTPDAQAVYPLGLRFNNAFLGDALDSRRWDLKSSDNTSVTFSIEVPGVARECGERRQEPQFRTAVQDNSARRTAATE